MPDTINIRTTTSSVEKKTRLIPWLGALVFLLFAAGQLLWIHLDQWPLSSDPVTNYGDLQDMDWKIRNQPRELIPFRYDFPPMLHLVSLPAVRLLGLRADSVICAGLLFSLVLYLSTWWLARRWFDRPVALAAAVMVLIFPANMALSRMYFHAYALEALVALSLALLVHCGGLRLPGRAFLLGTALGVGSLVKWTFPIFLLFPLLLVMVRAFVAGRRGENSNRSPAAEDRLDDPQPVPNSSGTVRPLTGLALMLLGSGLVGLPWYLANHRLVLDRFMLATHQNPTDLGGMFRVDFLYYPGRLIFMLALPGLLMALAGLWRAFRDHRPCFIFLLWTVVPPILLLSVMPARWPRYLVPALPAVAVLAAAALAGWRQRDRAGGSERHPPAPAVERGSGRVFRGAAALVLASCLLYGGIWSFTPLTASSSRITGVLFPRPADLGLDIVRPAFNPLPWVSGQAVLDTIDLMAGGTTQPVCLVAPYSQYDFNQYIFRYLAIERYPNLPLRFTGSFRGRLEPPNTEALFSAGYYIHKPGAVFRQRVGVDAGPVEPAEGTRLILERLLERFPGMFRHRLTVPFFDGITGALHERVHGFDPDAVALVLQTARRSGALPEDRTRLLCKILFALQREGELRCLIEEEPWLETEANQWTALCLPNDSDTLLFSGETAGACAVWGLTPGVGGKTMLCLEDRAAFMVLPPPGPHRSCLITFSLPEGIESQSVGVEVGGLPRAGTDLETGRNRHRVRVSLPQDMDPDEPLLFRLDFSRTTPAVREVETGFEQVPRVAARLHSLSFID